MESLKDANSSNYEVAIALLKMHGEGHKKNGVDAWARDVLDSVSDIEAHVKALESRNSSALKELRKKVEAKSKRLEEVRVDLNPLSLDMKRMLLEHYDWFISEIDSLLQQEGK